MNLGIFLVCGIYVLVCAFFAVRFLKSGWEKKRVVFLSLFLLSLLAAWLVGRLSPEAAAAQPIPFYKLFHISEYGYTSFLSDLVLYALPYVPAGILLLFAFPAAGVGCSILCGLVSSGLSVLLRCLSGAYFVADEIAYAAIGMGTGAGLLILFCALFQKKSFLAKIGLSAPSKGKFRGGLAVCAAMYLTIAFTMIADYGTTYGELSLSRPSTALPENITVETELSTESTSTAIYAAKDDRQLTLAAKVSRAFGMDGTFTEVDGTYVAAASDGGYFTYTPGSGWNYEFKGMYSGDVPDEAEAEKVAREYFESLELSGVSLEKLVNAVVKDNTSLLGSYNSESGITEEAYNALLVEAEKPTGVDLYFRSEIDGCPIIGDCEIMLSVRAGDTVTRVRKNGLELEKVGTARMITQKEAWERFLNGEGSHTLYEELTNASVTDVCLAYMLESAQGNYLPVWCFFLSGENTGGETVTFEAYVPCMK